GPYQLKEEVAKQELAKDVSGLANLSARFGVPGGHILLGVRTRRVPEHFGDVVCDVSPFPRGLVDPGDVQKVLEAWLLPQPEVVSIKWYASAADSSRGILALSLPPQRTDLWPFLVKKVIEERSGKIVGSLVGYYERRRDGVVAAAPEELQRLMRDGRWFGTI